MLTSSSQRPGSREKGRAGDGAAPSRLTAQCRDCPPPSAGSDFCTAHLAMHAPADESPARVAPS